MNNKIKFGCLIARKVIFSTTAEQFEAEIY